MLQPVGAADDQKGDPLSKPPRFDYSVEIGGVPDAAALADLEAALKLYRYKENGVPSPALLRRRAQDDVEIVAKVMRSHGFYEATARAEIAGDGADQPLAVTMTVEPGRAYRLERHIWSFPAATTSAEALLAPAAKFGSPVGEPAVAAQILEAEGRAVQDLKQRGYPYAKRTGREAVADPEQATIAVITNIDPGPFLVFGDVSLEGIPDVDETYLRTYQPWKKGEPVDVRQLGEYQQSLIQTSLFLAGSVLLPEEPPAGQAAPVTVVMEQRPFRSIALGARYSTDEGPGVSAEFEHRNLFGANEILNLLADVSLEEQRAEARLRKPQYLRPRQDLVGGLAIRRIEDDAFDELGVTLTLSLERQLHKSLRVGLGGLLEATDTTSSDAAGRSYLVGMPAFAAYDTTDDPLNPTRGWRARVQATPFAGQFDGKFTSFFSIDSSASTYFDLTGEKRFVLAARGRVGSVFAAELSDVPAGRRLFSGGGGSVRGYRERFIGPLDSAGDPSGGLSVAEVGVELRAQVYGDFGLAIFAEAGSVAEEVAPTFGDGVQMAAGGGLRYFSPLGPIRVDVGVPLNPRDSDDVFQIYFSIGQAF